MLDSEVKELTVAEKTIQQRGFIKSRLCICGRLLGTNYQLRRGTFLRIEFCAVEKNTESLQRIYAADI